MKLTILSLFLVAALALGQTAPSTPATPAPVAPATAATPKVFTPKPIVYKTKSIPGDILVQIDYENLARLQAQYQAAEKPLRDSLNPKATAIQTRIKVDIDNIRKNNDWDTTVTYDPQSQTWTKAPAAGIADAKPETLTPKPVKGTDLPGDVALQLEYDKLASLQNQYSQQEKAIIDKLTPELTKLTAQISDDIKFVQTDNNWGSTVIFDASKNQWIQDPTKK